MSPLSYPHRIYSLSDCHGGRDLWNPLESPDVAARLAESIRSDFPEPVQRIDTLSAPTQYYRHLVTETLRLHDEQPESGSTGLFINSAPRTKAGHNDYPFYRADFGENRLVVVTNLPETLSSVRDRISGLRYLPNKNNRLYPDREQHRSSYTPRMLAQNHGLELLEADRSVIPEPENRNLLSYVDRFGNLVLTQRTQLIHNIRSKIGCVGRELVFRIGDITHQVQLGHCLSAAQPGLLTLYENDGSLEILSKWKPEWNAQQRLEHSAYNLFRCPSLGSDWSLISEEERAA